MLSQSQWLNTSIKRAVILVFVWAMTDKKVLHFDLMHNIDRILRGAIIDSKVTAEWLQGIHRQ